MNDSLRKAIEKAVKDAYVRGFHDAIHDYAVWESGEQVVGVRRRKLRDVLENRPEDVLTEARKDEILSSTAYTDIDEHKTLRLLNGERSIFDDVDK